MELKRAEKRFRLATRHYARLAAFRRALREYLHFSEAAAAEAGLSSQHYQAMLILRGCPEGERITITELARQLLVKHNSAVGLVDRLAQEGLVVRGQSRADRRKVELRLTARGRRVLAKLAATHSRELHRIGPGLRRVLRTLSPR